MKKSAFILALASTLALLLNGPALARTVLDHILKEREMVTGTTDTQLSLTMTIKGGEIIRFDADIVKWISTGLGVKIRFSKMLFSEVIIYRWVAGSVRRGWIYSEVEEMIR